MRAGLAVDAFIGDAQTLDGTAMDQMLLHDLRGIFGLHIAVPDRIGVDHDGRTVLALVETERLIDADAGRQIGSFDLLLQLREQFALPVAGTGWARCAFGAGVVADENVVFKKGQKVDLLL